MAQGMKLGLHIPVALGYLISTADESSPRSCYGNLKALAKLPASGRPPPVAVPDGRPMVYLIIIHPDSVSTFFFA